MLESIQVSERKPTRKKIGREIRKQKLKRQMTNVEKIEYVFQDISHLFMIKIFKSLMRDTQPYIKFKSFLLW